MEPPSVATPAHQPTGLPDSIVIASEASKSPRRRAAGCLANLLLRLALFAGTPIVALAVVFLLSGGAEETTVESVQYVLPLLPLFPLGMFANFWADSEPDSILGGVLLVWGPYLIYLGLILAGLFVKKRSVMVVVYIVFCALIALNIRGCGEIMANGPWS